MTLTAGFSPSMAGRTGHSSAAVESSSAVTPGVGSPPPSIRPRAFPSSGRSGLARRPREEAAHQRTQRCATALRAGNLGFVMLADGEGDAHVPSTVVTVIFVHSHGGSSSRLLTPVDGPEGGEPKRTAGAIPRLDASHHREARRLLAFTRPHRVREERVPVALQRSAPSPRTTRLSEEAWGTPLGITPGLNRSDRSLAAAASPRKGPTP